MEKKQYLRAVAINKRIEELAEVMDHIGKKSKHRLSYSDKLINNYYALSPEKYMWRISSILDKHDRMIRQEIKDEINSLKKEIENC